MYACAPAQTVLPTGSRHLSRDPSKRPTRSRRPAGFDNFPDIVETLRRCADVGEALHRSARMSICDRYWSGRADIRNHIAPTSIENKQIVVGAQVLSSDTIDHACLACDASADQCQWRRSYNN
jgi:hypothetical protein